jgi:phosphoserine aminotransferase
MEDSEMARCYNFSAGPAVLPVDALEDAQAQLLDYEGTGMSIMESSHRGEAYSAVHEEAIANIRELMEVPEDYSVLFIQGGASMQFAMIPMNFLGEGRTADYINSGAWAKKAIKEAKNLGNVNVAADCGADIPTRMPTAGELSLTEGAAYLHCTSNETISGAQMKVFPTTDAPLICDMSSDILSRKIDVSKFGMIYAGAQKNLGPAGVGIVILRKDLAERCPETVPTILKYSTHIDGNSMFNTCPCFTIYMIMLVTRWIKKESRGNIFSQNVEKAGRLYAAIDGSDFYRGTALPEFRSDMNLTFRLPTEELEAQLIKEADAAGLKGLKGHRSVGGLRASIYNAFPPEGVDALVAFMKDFEARNG